MTVNICGSLMPILRVVAYILKLIQWAIPMLLIALATFDCVKSVMANDEKEVERAKSALGKRLVYAVVVFLVPIIIRLLTNLIASNLNNTVNGSEFFGPAKGIQCFNQALNEV